MGSGLYFPSICTLYCAPSCRTSRTCLATVLCRALWLYTPPWSAVGCTCQTSHTCLATVLCRALWQYTPPWSAVGWVRTDLSGLAQSSPFELELRDVGADKQAPGGTPAQPMPSIEGSWSPSDAHNLYVPRLMLKGLRISELLSPVFRNSLKHLPRSHC